jgi:hypothetical protein
MQAGAQSVSQPPTPTGEALVDDGETIHAFSELRQRLGAFSTEPQVLRAI